jgi:cell wall-associated NlpC family hydrolase
MRDKPGYYKFSAIVASLILMTVAVALTMTGQPNTIQPASNSLAMSQATLATEAGISGSYYPELYKYYAAVQREEFNTRIRAAEVIALYGNSVCAEPVEEEPAAEDETVLVASVADVLGATVTNRGKKVASMGDIPVSVKYVNANELNIRNGEGTDSGIITTLKRGEKVDFYSINGEWAKVRASSGVTGYVYAQYLVDKESDVEPEKPLGYRYVNADQLNVRTGAGTEFDKAATLKRGDKVGYFSSEGEWARIQTSSGEKGYAVLEYLVENERDVEWPRPVVTGGSGSTSGNAGASDNSGASDNPGSADTAGNGDIPDLCYKIVEYSKQFVGVKYVWAGYSTKGFDCSGLVKYVYAHFGISVPRSSADYAGIGTKVSRENLRPSDILLFDTDGGAWDVSHVGIYLGNDKFIHASTTKKQVIIMTLSEYAGKYYGARRVFD